MQDAALAQGPPSAGLPLSIASQSGFSSCGTSRTASTAARWPAQYQESRLALLACLRVSCMPRWQAMR